MPALFTKHYTPYRMYSHSLGTTLVWCPHWISVKRNSISTVRLRQHRTASDWIRPAAFGRKKSLWSSKKAHRRSFQPWRNSHKHKRSRRRKAYEGSWKSRPLSWPCCKGNRLYGIFCKPFAGVQTACGEQVYKWYVKIAIMIPAVE